MRTQNMLLDFYLQGSKILFHTIWISVLPVLNKLQWKTITLKELEKIGIKNLKFNQTHII